MKVDLSGRGDSLQALAHDGQGVFGWKQEHFARAPHGELAQASGPRRDADGDIQRQEALAAFGFAAEDADGLIGPQSFD
ncbi:MAG: hypothetical protein U1G07_09925 [Verrucomicrobiota bacterium]